MKEQTFTAEGRVRSLNAERSSHWTQRGQATRHWREHFGWLARARRVQFDAVHITAEVVQKRPLMDTGNCYPTLKAAIDGLVDGGVIQDDSPKYVKSITMMAPRIPGPDEPECLILTLREA